VYNLKYFCLLEISNRGSPLPRVDPEKKKQILESSAFQTWWNWRRKISPVPKDPFKAYMIDLGIPARLYEPDPWSKRVNRADWIAVDYPRMATRTERYPSEVRTASTQLEQLHKKRVETIMEAAREFTQHYSVPMPQIKILHEKGYFESYHDPLRNIVAIGIKGAKMPTLGVLFHELGHHVQYQKVPMPYGLTFSQARLWKEKKAYELAKPFLKHPTHGWIKRFGIFTYQLKHEPSVLKKGTFTAWTHLENISNIKEAKIRMAWLKHTYPEREFRLVKLTRKGEPTGKYRIYQGMKVRKGEISFV